MRAIFFVLLIANAAFFTQQFFWGSSKHDSALIKVDTSTSAAADNLQLLIERDGAAPKKSGSRVVIQGAPSSVDAVKHDLCTTIGPYEELLQAEYLVEQLSALGIESKITSIEVKEGEAYWVYLPPEMSEREAMRRLYELKKKSIESHIITKGDLTNGISFGRFADPAEADTQLKMIKEQGYNAQIKLVPKTISETWIVLRAEYAEKIDESAWARLLSKHNGIEKRQNFCLGVASQ